MTGTIVVGVVIALMFLVSFTQWFYHLAVGLDNIIVRDVYASYRIGGWILGGVVFVAGVFWVLSLVNECPTVDEEKEGIFAYLNCDVYWEGKSLLANERVSVLKEEAAERAAEKMLTR